MSFRDDVQDEPLNPHCADSVARAVAKARAAAQSNVPECTQMSALLPKQIDAVYALLTERNFAAAAKSIRVSPKTISRWMQEPQFRAAIEEASKQRLGDAVALLRSATLEATQTLRAALRARSWTHKISAARALLEPGLRVGQDDLEARIAALEEERNI